MVKKLLKIINNNKNDIMGRIVPVLSRLSHRKPKLFIYIYILYYNACSIKKYIKLKEDIFSFIHLKTD
jgi:hypothetical protein